MKHNSNIAIAVVFLLGSYQPMPIDIPYTHVHGVITNDGCAIYIYICACVYIYRMGDSCVHHYVYAIY